MTPADAVWLINKTRAHLASGPNAVQAARELGYDEGNYAGYERGYSKGHADGYMQGLREVQGVGH